MGRGPERGDRPAGSRDEASVEGFYRGRLRRFGAADPRCVGFTRAEQRARFKALCDLGDFDRRRLLDVGCGLGDLLPYLQERDIRPFYCGLDVCSEFIARCRGRFQSRPDLTCHFELGSVLDHRPAAPFDFVVASGLFGCAVPGAPQEIGPALERMLSWCTSGLAVNFFSESTHRRRSGNRYVQPSEMLAVALRLTPRVRIRHDYLPNDFTLYLYPSGAGANAPVEQPRNESRRVP